MFIPEVYSQKQGLQGNEFLCERERVGKAAALGPEAPGGQVGRIGGAFPFRKGRNDRNGKGFPEGSHFRVFPETEQKRVIRKGQGVQLFLCEPQKGTGAKTADAGRRIASAGKGRDQFTAGVRNRSGIAKRVFHSFREIRKGTVFRVGHGTQAGKQETVQNTFVRNPAFQETGAKDPCGIFRYGLISRGVAALKQVFPKG